MLCTLSKVSSSNLKCNTNFSPWTWLLLRNKQENPVLLSQNEANYNCSFHKRYYHQLSVNYYSSERFITSRLNLFNSSSKQVGPVRQPRQFCSGDNRLISNVPSVRGPSNSSFYSTSSSSSDSPASACTSNNNQNSPSRVLKHISNSSSNSSESKLSNLSKRTGNTRSVVTSPKFIEMEVQQQQQPSKQQPEALLQDPKLLTKEERNDFNKTFSQIVVDLTEMAEFRDMPETNKWLKRVLQYNVPHGKKNRGLACALAYKFMADELTEENMQLAYVLGWCVEMLQAFFLVADDIMDHSETRRGQPCWYKVDDLGPAAFNDAILIESSIYILLGKYFRNKDYYVDLLEIFHDATHKTVYGQSLDTRTGLTRKMETYTMELYSAIVKYKTSYYSFVLPVVLAMAMARINNPELRRQARTVTLEMGHFFQIQDDYLDCFGDEQVTGKIGTDIQDCKCSWLFVQAFQHATSEQREILLGNYGQDDTTKVAVIKKLYLEMNLEQMYKDYEEQSYNIISTHILQMSPELPKSLFMDMLHKIYKRSS